MKIDKDLLYFIALGLFIISMITGNSLLIFVSTILMIYSL